MAANQEPALVLGAGGFFGLAIVRALTAAGVPVLATDRLEPKDFAPRAGTNADLVRYVRRDLTEDSIDDLVAEVVGVIHAAAMTFRDEAADGAAQQVLRINLRSFLELLPLARSSGKCHRLIFVSSAAVYDQSSVGPFSESDADGGTSLYGAAKLAAELVGCRYAALAGLDFCCVRPTSLFGAGEIARPSRPQMTGFAQLVAAAARGEIVRLERPDSRHDWLCVDDAAEALALLWHTAHLGGRTFNLSSGRPQAFHEVAKALASAIGLRLDDKSSVVVDGGDDRPAVITNKRIREAVGWEPRQTFAGVAHDLLDASSGSITTERNSK